MKYLYFKKAGLGTQVQYLINCPRNHVITIIMLLLYLFCVKKITYLCAMCYLIVMIFFFCCCEKNPAIIICSLLKFVITVQLRYNIYLTNLLFVCCFERINVFSTHRAFSQIILEICQPESEKF